ncbi:MAG: glutamate--tRNA ligase [Bacteroidales bacterium]|nr:glutamate--tRNA ligase [Bacteroidales bacterium]
MNRDVRVRFAPSPTGPLHIGGVRTALFNYLFAKKNNGTFILRIEDTDQTRFVPGAEDYIVESLKWLGISPTEGQGIGGEYGPYRQSERGVYKPYANQLIDSGWAYYAFDTPESLSELRVKAEENKETFIYNFKTRQTLNNSLVLSKDEVDAKIAAGEPYVIRFKMPEDQVVEMLDIIRGEVKMNTKELDDKVLFKSDGLPTYHLANVVDDYLMKISHVIRGEEWLPSLPLHVMLYKALGWSDVQPAFAHLPLILKPTGNGKLSKRDGDKMGFPVFPLEWQSPNGEISKGYREDGYFPKAVVNMLALLGWSSGTDQEIFSLEELSNIFSLERVGKSGSKFDPDKAKWFNQQYLRETSSEELSQLFTPFLKDKKVDFNPESLPEIIEMVKDRVHFVHELWDQTFFFFEAPTNYNEKVVDKRWKGDVPELISLLVEKFEALDKFDVESIHHAVEALLQEKEAGMGKLMNAVRLAMTGDAIGPDLKQMMVILGKDESIQRLRTAVNNI